MSTGDVLEGEGVQVCVIEREVRLGLGSGRRA